MENSKDEYSFEKRVIAFIDILGFKEIIKNESERNKILTVLHQLQKNEQSYSKKCCDSPIPIQANVKILEHKQITINPDISCYSDNIIISAPISIEEYAGYPIPMDDFSNVLNTVSSAVYQLQIQLLIHGFAMRGGISYGDVHISQNRIIVGTPVSDAIEAEQKCAIYPRVIFTKDFLDHLGEAIYRRLFVKRDVDGMYFVDYLGSFFEFNNESQFLPSAQKIRTVIDNNIHASSNNIGRQAKWFWLANQFDDNVNFYKKQNPALAEVETFDLLKNNFLEVQRSFK